MIELVENKEHLVIKRDGRAESYNPDKLRQVLLWACDDKQWMVDEILQDIELKIYNRIYIGQLFDEVIDTVKNKISRIQPQWDTVARNLYLQKIYKETWGIKRDTYPDYMNVILKGIQYGLYDEKIVFTFDEQEIKELGEYIKTERDLLFNYLGLKIFMDKYSLSYKNKNLELPQHGFMRLAMFAFYKEPKEVRLDLIKKRYDNLSTFVYTEATPKWLNSLTNNPQMASCVLTQMPDDSWGINRTLNNLGLFSKYGGGLACDISPLRAKGSTIRQSGKSSGVIPFVKNIEAIVSSYNQLGKRQGACCVYFNWWHKEVKDILMLKDEGGTEDTRARKLQYAIKLNNIFFDKLKEDEYIYLFDPKEVPDLLEAYGDKFNELYKKYINDDRISKDKIKAVDLSYLIAKIRYETGNLYVFFDDNVNSNTPFKEYIGSSNLCCEITLPSKGSKLKTENLIKDYSTNNTKIIQEIDNGMISLCNLSSINIVRWLELEETEKLETAYNLLRASDNLIDYAYTPAKEGEYVNKTYRPIGIGLSNLAYHFARKGIKFTDKEALEEMDKVMKDIYFYILYASTKLASERGVFEKYYETKWADGWMPEYHTVLADRISKYGVRFVTHFAIAPTATSSLIVGATEGIEPVKELITHKTGTYNEIQMVPEINKIGMNYQTAWEVDNKSLLDLAAVRQKYLDQAQSINLYEQENTTAYDIISDMIYAKDKGIKTLYYLVSRKAEVEHCESCSS